MRTFNALLLCCGLSTSPITAQVLVDSIPYPSISQGFWGIHVNADTVFLGDDFSGDIYFSDHDGNILGTLPTGNDVDHGLIKRPGSYLIAEDYTTNGAHLFEVDLGGTLVNTWTFPDVIGGHSSGIGGICADGNAVWYSMYYPDFDVYPYAYIYKWIPGEPTAIDTVPTLGAQPYGVALKGDTLFYVMDNNDDDLEGIYAYDLTNEVDLGFIPVPDADGDQSPRGLFYDGEFLYLVANRIGGNAFAWQTVFIYSFDASTGLRPIPLDESLLVHPSPANHQVMIDLAGRRTTAIEVFDATGARVFNDTSKDARQTIDTSSWEPGIYFVQVTADDRAVATRRFVIAR